MKKMTGISKFNLFLALLVFCMIAGPACAAELSGNNNIGIDVGNDDGTYLVPGTAYQLNLEAGTADLHIASDPANSAGDITQVNTTSGTFYITCTNDSRVFDDTVLMLAVNGTIADNFSVAITSSGYRWAGPAENSTLPEYGNLTYVSSALSETFAKADLSYGPQIWKPANSANSSIYTNQNMSDTEDTFSLVFIDLKAGALCNATNLTSIDDLTDRGAMKIEYVFENLQSFAVFNAYGLTNTTSAEIVTTNDVSGSLYSVLIEPEAAEPVLDNITVSPSTASVEINATANFTATAYDTGGSEMSGITFNWSVSDEAVGNVTSGGMFTGLSAGTVNVTASFGNESGYAVVTVSEAVVPTPTPTPTPPTETYGGVMPAVNDVYLRVANDEGAYFNDWGNHTCRIKWVSGGFNSLHISNDSRGSDGYFVNYGQITETNDLSGTFYVSTTGGRGYQDDILMLVAVNGTVPDDFRLHITVNGYQWTPNSTPHLPPALQDITYVPLAVDEWFTKDDLIYGPQTWRPAGAIEYKIFPGQDVTDTSNKFYMMLIDLNAGVLTEETLEVNYEIENMNSLLAFNVYGYAKNVLHGTTVYYNTTEWSNCVDTSGWYVSGAPLPDAATVVIAPLSAEIPVNGKQQFTATAYDAEGSEINGASITWSSSVTGVGTIDSDGLFTPVSEGSTIITATAESGVSQTASVTVIAAVEKVLTTITLDPDGVIMYTDQIENKTFTATGYDQFGDELSAIYTWSSTVPVVGSIDQTGFFSGKTEGTTVISVTNGSVSQTATVVIKQHPDWDVTLIGATNRTLNRTGITDLSSGGLMSYTDNKGYVWEGVNLSVILALVDDNDPSTFNTTLASLDYNITIKGKASGNDKTVLITSREFIDDEKTLIAAYIMDGYEIPETSVSGRTYWPLKLTGSAIANYGRNIEEITNITIDFPPDVRRIGITSDSLIAFVGGLTNQFIGTAYGPDDQVIEYIPITWSVSDSSIGTIDSNGLFTPVKAGSVNVIATYHDISQSVAVSVLDSTDPVTWHVDRNGGRDFMTIQGAVDYAREGDTVIVHDGLYEEKVTIDKGLTLISVNGCNSTEIYYPDPEQFVVTSTADNVLISGFNITGYHSASNSYLGGIQISGDNCVISDNLFPTVRSIHVVSPENLTIENNLFIDNGNLEVDGVNHNLTIRNNVFYTFASKPMDIRGEGSDLVIFNNSITSTHSSSDGIVLYGAYNNVTVSENEIFCWAGIYVSVNENSDINSAKILNNNIQASKAAVYLYKDGEDIEIAGNRLSSGEYFVLLIHTPTGEVSVHHNELSSGYTQMTYMRYCEDYLNFYANNISIGSSNTGGLLRYSLATLNSTKQYTYEYNGQTFSGFIGNEYNTYSGIDTSGDFLGNTPFVEDGVYDYHPLTGTYSDYTILGEGKVPGDSQNATLDFNGLGVQENGEKQTATINTTQTQTTQNGNTLTISRANYDIEIELDSDMTTNGDEVTGTIKSVTLTTSEIAKSGGDAGNVSASIVANLNGIPNGASITTDLTDGASAAQRNAFQLAATDDGLRVGEVACTLSVIKQNLVNGADVASATIRMSIDKSWVDVHGGNDAMKIIRWSDDGTKEILNTVLIGTNGDMLIFEAVSPNGFSIFGLAATSVAPDSPVTSSAPATGGKSTVSTESVKNIGAGETVSLVFDESAVTKVDVKAAAEIPELMLTVEEVSKPSGIIDAPDEVYQYVEITAYRAPEESIAMATLHFNIVKDWLDSISSTPSDVSVYHYDEAAEEWVLLSTVSDGSDVYAYNFFADTPGFSLFAITAKENTASTADVSNPAADSVSESGMQSSETGSTAGSEEGIPLPYILLATGLIIGIPAAGYGWIRIKEK